MSIHLINRLIDNFSINNLISFLASKLSGFQGEQDDYSHYLNNSQSEKYSDVYKVGETTLNGNEQIIAITVKTIESLTERSGKKVQYDIVKTILKDEKADLAFFVFHDIDGNFRFSIVHAERENNKTSYSTFKRYTYYVSKQQTNKSFREQVGNANFGSIDEIVKAFSVEKLNKEFYNELSNWYFWATTKVVFPDDAEKNEEIRNATSVIRLITRLIFVWFLRHKKLVPNELFDKVEIDAFLNYSDKTGSTYYKAILQNLFFATLNTEMLESKRKFVHRQTGIQGFYRYERFFSNKNRFLELTRNIPFLNGGLFENLDKNAGEPDEIRIDCFSNRRDLEEKLVVPDYLFFGETSGVNLNDAYGDKNHTNVNIRGIMDILNSYNFTIEENNPVEVEVALDPELLGKAFENLLASYNPETQTTARKQSGSFYTPREIVDYMCDESLLAYLKEALKNTVSEKDLRNLITYNNREVSFKDTEKEELIKAIDNCKILDPACGSGAFPMGILQKMVFILQKLDPENKQWKLRQEERAKKENKELVDKLEKDIELINKVSSLPELKKQALSELELRLQQIEKAFELNTNELDYARKLYLIENGIYGVDIQPIAIQISKLRFFISLLVEQTVDDTQENRGIIPMPNMETKFVAANTLISLSKENIIKPQIIYPLEVELKEVRHRHFSARTPETKKKYRLRDKELRNEISDILVDAGFLPASANQIAEWNPYDQNTSAGWFDSEWMFGLNKENARLNKTKTDGYFDIVLGNPPYIKEGRISKTAFKQYKNSPYYQGKMDLWYMFACKGIDFLKNNGHLCFIATNNWVTSNGASKLRNKIISESQIKQLIDFGNFMIFESASIQTMIMLFSKDDVTDNYTFDYRKLQGNTILSDVIDLLETKPNPKATYIVPKIIRNDFKNAFLNFTSEEKDTILAKVADKGVYLTEREMAQGMVLPQDFLNKKNQVKLGNNFVVGQGVFGLSNKEMSDLQLSENELKLIRPYYTTEQIHRYYSNPENKLWVIYTDSSFKNQRSMDNYPNLKKHLDRFASVVTSDNKPYGLHRAREEKFFKGEKVIVQRKCVGRPSFSYSNFDCYVSATFYIIKSERFNAKFLLGLLNSKLITFWLKNKGKMQGDNYQLDKEPLLQIPIPSVSLEEQQPVISFINEILAIKQESPTTDTNALENEIDKLVYELYELTKEEIGIIAG